MNADPEIVAMGDISRALSTLDQEAVRRVLKWAIERYQGAVRQPSVESSAPMLISAPAIVTESTRAPDRTFLDVPELFDAASAETGLDKVLVVAYWFQILQHAEDWDSQSVNAELKHLGHPSSNITRDLDALMAKTPKLAMQVRKQGTTKQARKRYKLTREGVKAVEWMISRTAPFAERS